MSRSKPAPTEPLEPSYTLTLDGPTIDALYTAIAGPRLEAVERRLGGGGQHRAFNQLHRAIAGLGIPAPPVLREQIKAEGYWSTQIAGHEHEWGAWHDDPAGVVRFCIGCGDRDQRGITQGWSRTNFNNEETP